MRVRGAVRGAGARERAETNTHERADHKADLRRPERSTRPQGTGPPRSCAAVSARQRAAWRGAARALEARRAGAPGCRRLSRARTRRARPRGAPARRGAAAPGRAGPRGRLARRLSSLLLLGALRATVSARAARAAVAATYARPSAKHWVGSPRCKLSSTRAMQKSRCDDLPATLEGARGLWACGALSRCPSAICIQYSGPDRAILPATWRDGPKLLCEVVRSRHCSLAQLGLGLYPRAVLLHSGVARG